MKPAGQTVTHLESETLCLYLLVPSNVGDHRKRELVNEAVTWGDDSRPQRSSVNRRQATSRRWGQAAMGRNRHGCETMRAARRSTLMPATDAAIGDRAPEPEMGVEAVSRAECDQSRWLDLAGLGFALSEKT